MAIPIAGYAQSQYVQRGDAGWEQSPRAKAGDSYQEDEQPGCGPPQEEEHPDPRGSYDQNTTANHGVDDDWDQQPWRIGLDKPRHLDGADAQAQAQTERTQDAECGQRKVQRTTSAWTSVVAPWELIHYRGSGSASL
jgi:hypothetical protein